MNIVRSLIKVNKLETLEHFLGLDLQSTHFTDGSLTHVAIPINKKQTVQVKTGDYVGVLFSGETVVIPGNLVDFNRHNSSICQDIVTGLGLLQGTSTITSNGIYKS